jgi:hypothetical protein
VVVVVKVLVLGVGGDVRVLDNCSSVVWCGVVMDDGGGDRVTSRRVEAAKERLATGPEWIEWSGLGVDPLSAAAARGSLPVFTMSCIEEAGGCR